MSRILLTGITGFCGSHLANFILTEHREWDVFGLTRWRSPKDNIQHLLGHGSFVLKEGDLLDQGSLIRVLAEVQPDYIWHGAAQSYVQSSFQNPSQTMQVNVLGTLNLFEAIRIVQTITTDEDGSRWSPKIVAVSSSEVYGQPEPEEIPIKETNPLRPVSPYAVSKASMDLLAYQYYENFGLKIVRTRMFSHEGSRRGEVFCLSSFAKQLMTRWQEKDLPGRIIKVGNLDSVRTWAHIDDAVRAYWLAFYCSPGEVYNIGGKETTTVGAALDRMLKLAFEQYGLQAGIEVDPTLIRLTDVTMQLPDCTKFKTQTGWEPQKGLDVSHCLRGRPLPNFI
jgi:GDP-mannose 4,6-dehydratase